MSRRIEIVDPEFGITQSWDPDFLWERLSQLANSPTNSSKDLALQAAQILWNYGGISKEELAKFGMKVIPAKE